MWWFGGGGWERICVVWVPLSCNSTSLSGCSATVPRHSGPHTEWVFFLFFQRCQVWSGNFCFSLDCLFIYILNDLAREAMLLNNSTPLPFPLQQSPGTKANEWSSPTWSYCSASSFVTTSFPTTSTCARLFPVVIWPLTPTCLAHVPPVTNLRMNQSVKIRRPAATARTRQVGGSCCCEVRWLSCRVWCGIKSLHEAAVGSTGYRSVRIHGNRSQLQY